MRATDTTSPAPAGAAACPAAAPAALPPVPAGFRPAPTAPLHPMLSGRDAQALARLRELLAQGVALHDAILTASEHGRELAPARLRELYSAHSAWAARRLGVLQPRAAAALWHGDRHTWHGAVKAARRLAADDVLSLYLDALTTAKTATENRP